LPPYTHDESAKSGWIMLANPDYTPEVAAATANYYDHVKTVIPEVEWPVHAPYVAAINALKKERNAVILAHNYMTPEIFHCVADITGDSLALARRAAETDADVIVLAGVHFMAETAKLLNPEKTVLIPDMRAGCSLAESITAADIRKLREKHPGVPVVTYVNTSAEVKAESDICCTSGNAVAIVESLGCDEVIFLPDEYLANYVAQQTDVKIITWKGHCEVHERFTPQELQDYRARRSRLRRLDGADEPLRRDPAAEARAYGHRVFHERQRCCRRDRRGIHPALQPVSAHETNHAGKDIRVPGEPGAARGDRPAGRGESTAGRGTHA
jgi:hypothetical protein